MRKLVHTGILFLLCIGVVLAHPHTFITTFLEPVIEARQLKGFWINWEFDELFSATVLDIADANQDGVISAQELPTVEQEAFANLAHYGYFIFFREGDKRWSPKAVEKFSAKNHNGKMQYRFFVAYNKPGNSVIISIIDPSFYCATPFSKTQPIRFTKTAPTSATYMITPNKKYPVYYDPKGAIDDTTIHTQWRKGLLTAYPEEATITW